jgi:hypothetical protein
VTAYDGGDWNTDPGLVERVAAAMFGHGWGFTDEGGRAYWSDLARAAIGAMPTVPAQPPTPPTRTDTPAEVDEDGLTALEQEVARMIYNGVLGQFSYESEAELALLSLEPRTLAKEITAHIKAAGSAGGSGV